MPGADTGTLSGWLGLGALGIPVDVIDARQARAVMRLQHNKTDTNDAELLAEIARSGFCRPVSAKSASAQEGRVLLKSRSHLVRQRRDTQNTIRGLLASLGLRFPEGSGKPATRVRAALADHPELRPAIAPLLSSLSGLEAMVAELDKAIAARTTDDPACRLLMTVPGVGPVTALAYVSTIGAGERFAKSRSVGAYVGLTSRRWQSGEMDYAGRISKHGDAMLRSLLTVVCRAHPLKDWARRIRKRTSCKKACVALARRLAVIMHRMLITGEPFRWPPKQTPDPSPRQAQATA